MNRIACGLAISGALLAAAATGLAGPASADQLNGTYTATVTGGSMGASYTSTPYAFTPCGANCLRLAIGPSGGSVVDLHPEGNTWTGTFDAGNGTICTETVNVDTLAASRLCSGVILNHQLSKP